MNVPCRGCGTNSDMAWSCANVKPICRFTLSKQYYENGRFIYSDVFHTLIEGLVSRKGY